MGIIETTELIHPDPMTLDEWADMDEDQPGELVGGRLEEEEVPDHLHEAVVAFLIRVLGLWASPRRAPVFGSEHKLGVAPTRGRKPDVSMYDPGTRLGRGSLSRTPPLLAVEVLSPRPRDVRRDRRDKVTEYARFGVRLYLLVDPEARLVELYELGADGRYVHDASCSEGKMTLPGCEGLEIDLDALWSEADWVIGEESKEAGPACSGAD
jgi:Uma2 family endonuclease